MTGQEQARNDYAPFPFTPVTRDATPNEGKCSKMSKRGGQMTVPLLYRVSRGYGNYHFS